MSTEFDIVEPASVGMNPGAIERLLGRISRDTGAGLYDGAVIVLARGGQVVCHEAIGFSELASERRARSDDVYFGMSVSKSFTAAGVLRLIDQGRLSLSTRIADVVPGFGAKGKEAVTVRHLLTHTGGTWSNFFLPPPLRTDLDSGNLAKSVQAVCNLPLEFTPGSTCRYNPWASYAVLGDVLQRLDERRRRFRDIMAEDWFAPMGMSKTAFGVPRAARVPLVLREAAEGATDRAVFDMLDRIADESFEHPAGGASTTAGDLFRFAEMWRRGGSYNGQRMLSPAMVDLALRVHSGDLPNTFWDYSRQMRGIGPFPANMTLAGGYLRGEGQHFSPLGELASPRAFCAIGGGSTMFMIDPARDLSFVFVSAGLLEGLNHFARLACLNDLVFACVED